MAFRLFALLVASCLIGHFVVAADSPQFRGPFGTGVAAKADVPLDWSGDKNLAWKAAIPGSGWSQPVIVGERVFVTSAVADKALKPDVSADDLSDSRAIGRSKGIVPEAVIEWQVHCLDAQSGKLLWSRTVAMGKPKYAIHPSNTFASETPAADARGVYAYFGATGDLAAFDHQGEPLWRHNLGAYPTPLSLGTGSSPAIADERLFLQLFTDAKSELIAFELSSGKELWRKPRDKAGTAWATPLVWRNRLRTEVVVFGQEAMTGHDPQTGEELWRASGLESPIMCSATADAERLYFGRIQQGKTGPLSAIKAGAKGSISPKKGEPGNEFIAWQTKSAGANVASPVAADGFVYVVEQDLLSCYDAATGARKYRERLPNFRAVAASLVVVGERLIVLDQSGAAVTVKAGAEFAILGAGELEDTFWTTPAVAHEAIYLRGVEWLYCVRK